MKTEQLRTLLGDLFILSPEEREKEEWIAQYLAGDCPPEIRARVEGLLAEDESLRADVEARRRGMQEFTPARLARLEERILAQTGRTVAAVAVQAAPLRPPGGAVSAALVEAIAGFMREIRFLLGPVHSCATSEREHLSKDQSAIVRLNPLKDGVEIEVISENVEDTGARIEVFARPGDWRAELTLKQVLRGSSTVRDAVMLTGENLRRLDPDAIICLRAVQ
ncbi:MAG TPA: hypothetical protein VJU77_16855 [Chthoniobacterales bacterium]|nr:hypothetical protein [Chthoniobacterales bacterium]